MSSTVSSSLALTPFQRAVLRRLAQGVNAYQVDELRLLAHLAIFLVLETLEVSPSQIDSILGVEVTAFLNAFVDASAQAGAKAATAALDRVPCFGAVTSDGRIVYTEAAQRWLQEHDHAQEQNHAHHA